MKRRSSFFFSSSLKRSRRGKQLFSRGGRKNCERCSISVKKREAGAAKIAFFHFFVPASQAAPILLRHLLALSSSSSFQQYLCWVCLSSDSCPLLSHSARQVCRKTWSFVLARERKKKTAKEGGKKLIFLFPPDFYELPSSAFVGVSRNI